jgi:hypothetical protein
MTTKDANIYFPYTWLYKACFEDDDDDDDDDDDNNNNKQAVSWFHKYVRM